MLRIELNTQEILAQMEDAAKQVTYATMVALNKTAEQAKAEMLTEVARTIDRPTPWTMNSLRIKYATRSNLSAEVAFKDRATAGADRSVLQPHAFGGRRHYKTMEVRLLALGLLPAGWNAVPGAAAQIDGFGNMAQGQINQILNVVQSIVTAGGGKPESKTITRLAKGNKKKGVYGFEYFIAPVGDGKGIHPGIYQRVQTGFGSSIKPVLMFVKQAAYKQRFEFFSIGQRVVDRDLQPNFSAALQQAIATARTE